MPGQEQGLDGLAGRRLAAGGPEVTATGTKRAGLPGGGEAGCRSLERGARGSVEGTRSGPESEGASASPVPWRRGTAGATAMTEVVLEPQGLVVPRPEQLFPEF